MIYNVSDLHPFTWKDHLYIETDFNTSHSPGGIELNHDETFPSDDLVEVLRGQRDDGLRRGLPGWVSTLQHVVNNTCRKTGNKLTHWTLEDVAVILNIYFLNTLQSLNI